MSAPRVPEHRRQPLAEIIDLVRGASAVVLTTHVNADGDGAGSEAALAAWIVQAGKRCTIVNPTPFPELYRFVLPEGVHVVTVGEPGSAEVLQTADLFVVLDTAEAGRLGKVPKHFRDRRVVVIDHHPPSDVVLDGTVLQDTTACATGELIYDLLQLAIGAGSDWPDTAVQGIYAAIVTDTGSFRFANTSARTHSIACDLLRRGVDPEAVYRRIFATVPLRRIEILRTALASLAVDPELPLAWISIPPDVSRRLNPTAEDLEGIVEYARSIEGTQLAILFRETSGGGTKISFRSNGEADVNVLARKFGGGGHVKASGAVVGLPLAVAEREVLNAARELLQALPTSNGPG